MPQIGNINCRYGCLNGARVVYFDDGDAKHGLRRNWGYNQKRTFNHHIILLITVTADVRIRKSVTITNAVNVCHERACALPTIRLR